MSGYFITCLQLFGIGLSFGMAGPCFLSCAPVLITYILGRRQGFPATLGNISIFCIGRLAAYILLGAFAGISGAMLRRFVSLEASSAIVNFSAGAISVALATFILIRKDSPERGCGSTGDKACSSGGLLLLGFVLGISPCGPLTILLAQITLMSNSALDGMAYSASFGLGTLLSSLITVGAAAGIAGRIVGKFVRSVPAIKVFRILCASLLIIFGIYLAASGMGVNI